MVLNKRLVMGLLALVLLALGLGWVAASVGTRPADPVLHRVARGAVAAEFQAHGVFQFAEQARLSPELMGRVLKVHVREGDAVHVQQLLLELDPALLRLEADQLDAQLAQARAKLAQNQLLWRQAQERLAREQLLWREGMSHADRWSEVQQKEATAQLDVEMSAQFVRQVSAQRARAREMLERLAVRSPMAGRVIRIGVKAGETAVPSAVSLAGSELLVLADPDSLEIEAQIAEQDLPRVHLGQPVKARAIAFPDVVLQGRVQQISPRPRTSTVADAGAAKVHPVAVRIKLQGVPDDLKQRLWSEMAADVSFGLGGNERAVLVPLAALQHEDESALSSLEAAAFGTRRRSHVWLIKAGRVEKRPLVLGVADAQHQEVLEGLAEGDQIVLGPPALFQQLRPGQSLSLPPSP